MYTERKIDHDLSLAGVDRPAQYVRADDACRGDSQRGGSFGAQEGIGGCDARFYTKCDLFHCTVI